MKTTLPSYPTGNKDLFSEETTVAILETYMRSHGPCLEERLEAVHTAAVHAAVSLILLRMTFDGSATPIITDGALRFLASPKGHSCGPWQEVVERVVREVAK